jgi:predicted ATPase/DNA-binding XRE family transcriptional regulator
MPTTDGPGAFGALLQQYRRAAGLSQEELAERARLSRRGISDLERGTRRAPHLSTARRLADALELPPANRAILLGAALPPAQPLLEPSIEAPPGLSAPPTSFIGRERELRALTALLPTTRLLTLMGPGGVGKSRLAMHLAAQIGRDGGVQLVELVALADPSLVPQAIALALGLPDQPGIPVVDTLVAALRPRRLLLVLDNCEHLAAACAAVIAALLRGCPEVSILATSRVTLAVAGETTWSVPGMELPDPNARQCAESVTQSEAVRLFVARARAVAPGFIVTDRTSLSIAEACRRLEGLPLAIELAAAWMRVLSPQDLSARLSENFALLVGGSRDAPERQLTLRATLDWSYQLLSGPEQSLLNRISVFSGGASLAAIEGVDTLGEDGAPPVLESLAHLVDASLVQRLATPSSDEPRFRLLEMVRDYAREQLDASGEAEHAYRRHADYYVAMAEDAETKFFRGPEGGQAAALLEAEHDNLRAALGWSLTAEPDAVTGLRLAGALWPFWMIRGHYAEGRHWLEQLLQAGGRSPAAARAKALHGIGQMARNLRDYGSATTALEESVRIARELGDRPNIAWRLEALADVALKQGDYARSTVLGGESLQSLRDLGDKVGIGWSLRSLGRMHQRRGDLDQAEPLYREALALLRACPDQLGVIWTLIELGELNEWQDRRPKAADAYGEALLLARQIGDRKGVATCLGGLGRVLPEPSMLEQALDVWRELGDRLATASTLRQVAVAAHGGGDTQRGLRLVRESVMLYRQLVDCRGLCRCADDLAVMLRGRASAEEIGHLLTVVATVRTELDGPLAPGARVELEQTLEAALDRVEA